MDKQLFAELILNEDKKKAVVEYFKKKYFSEVLRKVNKTKKIFKEIQNTFNNK